MDALNSLGEISFELSSSLSLISIAPTVGPIWINADLIGHPLEVLIKVGNLLVNKAAVISGKLSTEFCYLTVLPVDQGLQVAIVLSQFAGFILIRTEISLHRRVRTSQKWQLFIFR